MRKTKIIKIRDLSLGGGNPVLIQSMIKTALSDIKGVLYTIKELKKEGCEIIRVAYKSESDTNYLKKIIKNSVLPVEIDIHFQSQLALNALRMNADAIRINPGNMEKKYLKEVILSAKERRVPIRIGINKGSLPQAQKGKAGFADACVKLIKEYVIFF